jgi:hypothetical protein
MRLYNDVALALLVKMRDNGMEWNEIYVCLHEMDASLFKSKHFCFAVRMLMLREYGMSEFEVDYLCNRMFSRDTNEEASRM